MTDSNFRISSKELDRQGKEWRQKTKEEKLEQQRKNDYENLLRYEKERDSILEQNIARCEIRAMEQSICCLKTEISQLKKFIEVGKIKSGGGGCCIRYYVFSPDSTALLC